MTSYTTVYGQITAENRAGTKHDYLPDPLGSTVALLDSSQNVTNAMSYWPFGEEAAGNSTLTPFRFVGTWGYYTDQLNTRTYVRARTYEPHFGSWINVDPLWPGQPSYAYSSNSPVLLMDPSGLWAAIINEPAAGGLTYSHSYIQFENPCMGAKSFGFGSYHSRNHEAGKRLRDPRRGGVVCSPMQPPMTVPGPQWGETTTYYPSEPTGAVLFPDPASRNFPQNSTQHWQLYAWESDSRFERALCECIKNSLAHGAPQYCFMGLDDTGSGFYVCGSWTRDMWDCARKKVPLPRIRSTGPWWPENPF